MSRPAARVGDQHFCPLAAPPPVHAHVGGPILPRDRPRTFINGKPAARVTDKADCKVALDDTVRGGLMTVFIDGQPAARMNDNTDIGLIMDGSPTVLFGEDTAAPLTPFQVQWLYKYLNSQRDAIPFEYINNGCEARADRMCELMESLGIPVEKQWVRATRASGRLKVKIANYPKGGVVWDWHVAPVIHVAVPGGSQRRVIDPSLGFMEPVTVDEWIRKQSANPAATVTGSTSKEVYRRAWNETEEFWVDSLNVLRTSIHTHRALDGYRKWRTMLPNDSGRIIPNNPVHF